MSDPFMMLHQMNRIFDDVFHSPAMGQSGGLAQGGIAGMVNAHMNVSENDHEICITAELPGVSEDDVDVRLQDDMLTISGEKKFEQERGSEKENFHFIERSYGTFQRSIHLPTSADPEQVKASFDKGVLTIIVPKNPEKERSHKIRIESGASASRTGSQMAGQASETTSIGGERQQSQPSMTTASGPIGSELAEQQEIPPSGQETGRR